MCVLWGFADTLFDLAQTSMNKLHAKLGDVSDVQHAVWQMEDCLPQTEKHWAAHHRTWRNHYSQVLVEQGVLPVEAIGEDTMIVRRDGQPTMSLCTSDCIVFWPMSEHRVFLVPCK